MYNYEVNVNGHKVRGFSMTREWAKKTLLIEIRMAWDLFGWSPAEWRISWEHGEEGGTLWRA